MSLAGYYASQHRHLKQQQGRFPLKTAEEDEYEMDEDFGDEDNDYDENDPNESLGSRA